ncbi:MAG: hypothetical protein ACOVLC_12980 [Flavobacterium sp.]
MKIEINDIVSYCVLAINAQRNHYLEGCKLLLQKKPAFLDRNTGFINEG